MKGTPTAILLIIGLVLIWVGVNGTLGTLLASIMTPSQVQLKADLNSN